MQRPRTPSDLPTPAFLMSAPFSLDTKVHNNPYMDEHEEGIDLRIAFHEFQSIVSHVSQEGLVYLLPSYPGFQDQTYVANLGCYLPHLDNMILVSRFKSEPRIGEEAAGKMMFHEMGYDFIQSPFHFEGEADLKFLRDNIYLAGHGIRTDEQSHSYMRNCLGMEVISLQMKDDKLYHLDCTIMPISKYEVLCSTSAYAPEEIRSIEQVANIIPIPEQYLYDGWTNSLLVNRHFYFREFGDGLSDLLDLLDKLNFYPTEVSLSEFEKSGAGLSCMVMHLNYNGI